jgi:hypothetical protein
MFWKGQLSEERRLQLLVAYIPVPPSTNSVLIVSGAVLGMPVEPLGARMVCHGYELLNLD